MVERRVLRVQGVVQGVGFRPFVHGLATTLGLAGTVRNDASGVLVDVEGPPDDLAEFQRRLHDDAPPLAIVTAVHSECRPVRGRSGFRVDVSDAGGEGVGPVTALPPDVATCDDCRREMFDPADRRYRYPFITCTNCGPRFTITTAVPYDRPNTTMAGFPLCDACRAEYENPADRRFHAQPLACPDCGPHLALVRSDGEVTARRDDALRATQRLLETGAVVAVQGIGGFHLMCDATNTAAVDELRRRKRRGAKPFAVMIAGLAGPERDDPELASPELAGPELDQVVDLGEVERAVLTSPARPILLARRRRNPGNNASWPEAVAPGAADVGVMLAYSPLHHLLFDGLATGVLVCTSGNLADEPIAIDPAEAFERLADLADAWLWHDRPIHTPCDDSVVRVVHGAAVPIRRSRGWTPIPIDLTGAPGAGPPVLALGGDLKGVVCVADGQRAWLSQHLGDLVELATYRAARRAIDQLLDLTRVTPAVVAVDAHPAYLSTRLGREFAAECGAKLVPVQHHHAHVASVLAEWGRLDPAAGPVVGFAFDGTGYGVDGTIWGGEVLVTDVRAAERVAHLAPIALPGGDAAIEVPARSALAHLWAAGEAFDPALPCVGAVSAEELAVVRVQLERRLATVPTSSMGRLFDAVASLAGVRHRVDYEAQAAIELEAAADVAATGRYEFPPPDANGAIDAGAVIRAVVADVRSGATAGEVSMRFHRAVTALVVDVARRLRNERGLVTVALTGGVFQNALLTEACLDELEVDGFEVLHHRLVPPNDGGLALGQVLVAGAVAGAAASGQDG